MFIWLPFTINKLEIAFINVSIVLNVYDNAKINTDTTIRDFFSSKIKLKKARSGVTFEFNEKDIKPEYPIQKTIIKIIIDELIKLFFKIELFFAEKTLCQFPWWNKLVQATAMKKVKPAV